MFALYPLSASRKPIQNHKLFLVDFKCTNVGPIRWGKLNDLKIFLSTSYFSASGKNWVRFSTMINFAVLGYHSDSWIFKLFKTSFMLILANLIHRVINQQILFYFYNAFEAFTKATNNQCRATDRIFWTFRVSRSQSSFPFKHFSQIS